MATYDYVKLTFAQEDGWSSLSPNLVYYCRADGYYYTRYTTDGGFSGQVEKFNPPSRLGWRFRGVTWPFTSVNLAPEYNGQKIIDEDGTILPAFEAACDAVNTAAAGGTVPASARITEQLSFVVTLRATDDSGYTNPVGYLFWKPGGHEFYRDEECTEQTGSIVPPVRKNYAFKNYTASSTEYIERDGTIGASLYSKFESAPADFTLTAQWESLKKIPIKPNYTATGVSDSNIYYSTNFAEWFSDEYATTNLERRDGDWYIIPPRRSQYSLTGIYNSSSGSTIRIEASGRIVYTPTTSGLSVYCRWTKSLYKLAIAGNGGDSGTENIYFGISDGVWYLDEYGETALSSIVPQRREGYYLRGVYSDAAGTGVKYFDAAGTPTAALASFSIANDTTSIHCVWGQLFTLTLGDSLSTEEHGRLYCDPASGAWYNDGFGLQEFDAQEGVAIPARPGYAFMGYFGSDGVTQYFDAAGLPAAGFAAISADTVIYTRWRRVSYPVVLDFRGGYAEVDMLYATTSGDGFLYADEQCTVRVETVDVPARRGYVFAGYYSMPLADAALVIDASGEIVAVPQFATDAMIFARWVALEFSLVFDPTGGACPESSRLVAYDAEIGVLPTPEKRSYSFTGWFVDGEELTAGTVWRWVEGKTASAKWEPNFSGVTDWFGLASDALVPFSADAGDARSRYAVSHSGKFEKDGTTTHAIATNAGIWRNPVVKYMVVRDTTISIQLGKGYAKSAGTSGYMITGVEIATQAGGFPVVTVTGTANEGANSINNFSVNRNKFNVEMPVKANGRAQNLLGALASPEYLQSMTIRGVCDPVVCTLNGMPCASDIVRGRLELSAAVIAPERENAPAASNGFVLLAATKGDAAGEYQQYSISAIKEMF